MSLHSALIWFVPGPIWASPSGVYMLRAVNAWMLGGFRGGVDIAEEYLSSVGNGTDVATCRRLYALIYVSKHRADANLGTIVWKRTT